MSHRMLNGLARGCLLAFLLTSLLLIGLIWQQSTGGLWLQQRTVELSESRESQGGSLRFGIRVKPGYRDVTRLEQGGVALEPLPSRRDLDEGGEGVFTWTEKNLWVTPFDGSEAPLNLWMPVPIPWWIWLVAGIVWIGVAWLVLTSSTDRSFLSRSARRVETRTEDISRMSDGVLSKIVLGCTVLGVVAVHAGVGRPLWIDEFLHFCLGAYPTWSAAWSELSETLIGINHGQTGVYMMLDYLLLKGFGADPFMLRLPSLLSGLWLFGSAILLLRWRGASWLWQLLAVLALAGQTEMMFYLGEARPYLPLAASSLGVLAYYLAPLEMRTTFLVRLWGGVSVLWGVLMHPYFAVYWWVAFAVSAVDRGIAKGSLPTWRELVRWVNLPLSLVGVLVFFGVGSLSWLRGGPEFDLDPFQWIGREVFWQAFLNGAHLQFLTPLTGLFLASGLTVLLLVLIPALRSGHGRELVAPLLVIAAALGVSLLLSYLSYRRDYWLLARQWVASALWLPVAWVWTLQVGSALFRPGLRWIPSGLALCLGIHLVRSGLHPLPSLLRADPKIEVVESEPLLAPKPLDDRQRSQEEWVELANENVRHGGPVWKVFQGFYRDVKESDKSRE